MKVAAIALDLRPRSMFEACDLGVRIVSANARSLARGCLPVYAALLVVAAVLAALGTGWAAFFLFWMKPWFDRTILFVLGRAVFGEETRFADVWAARRAVFWHGLLGALTIRRLSPWRSYVQPVLQLEGQRGKARRERVSRILGSHRGAALAMTEAFAITEFAISFGLATLPGWLLPAEDRGGWLAGLLTGSVTWIAAAQVVCYAIAVAVVEPFFVGAGFAMYLNRRVELEAWDIEQEFRLAFAA